MPYCHCILIHLSEPKTNYLTSDDIWRMKLWARLYAMEHTEEFRGEVFHDRTIASATPYESFHPGIAVILGATDKEEFLNHLEVYRHLPLEAAMEGVLHGFKTRSSEEVRRDPDLISIPSFDSQEVYSGYPIREFVVNIDTLCRIWNGEIDSNWVEDIAFALQLVNGNYRLESRFYSIPDGASRMTKETYDSVKRNPEEYVLVMSAYHVHPSIPHQQAIY